MDFATYFKEKYQSKLLHYLQISENIRELKIDVYKSFNVDNMKKLADLILKEELPLIRELESSLKLVAKFKEKYSSKLRPEILNILSTLDSIEHIFERKTLFHKSKLENVLKEQAKALYKYNWENYKELLREQNKFSQDFDLLIKKVEPSEVDIIRKINDLSLNRLLDWFFHPKGGVLCKVVASVILIFVLMGASPKSVYSEDGGKPGIGLVNSIEDISVKKYRRKLNGISPVADIANDLSFISFVIQKGNSSKKIFLRNDDLKFLDPKTILDIKGHVVEIMVGLKKNYEGVVFLKNNSYTNFQKVKCLDENSFMVKHHDPNSPILSKNLKLNLFCDDKDLKYVQECSKTGYLYTLGYLGGMAFGPGIRTILDDWDPMLKLLFVEKYSDSTKNHVKDKNLRYFLTFKHHTYELKERINLKAFTKWDNLKVRFKSTSASDVVSKSADREKLKFIANHIFQQEKKIGINIVKELRVMESKINTGFSFSNGIMYLTTSFLEETKTDEERLKALVEHELIHEIVKYMLTKELLAKVAEWMNLEDKENYMTYGKPSYNENNTLDELFSFIDEKNYLGIKELGHSATNIFEFITSMFHSAIHIEKFESNLLKDSYKDKNKIINQYLEALDLMRGNLKDHKMKNILNKAHKVVSNLKVRFKK